MQKANEHLNELAQPFILLSKYLSTKFVVGFLEQCCVSKKDSASDLQMHNKCSSFRLFCSPALQMNIMVTPVVNPVDPSCLLPCKRWNECNRSNQVDTSQQIMLIPDVYSTVEHKPSNISQNRRNIFNYDLWLDSPVAKFHTLLQSKNPTKVFLKLSAFILCCFKSIIPINTHSETVKLSH